MVSDDIDFVEYLRLWASPNPNDQAVRDLHKAADEIERLRSCIADLIAAGDVLAREVEIGGRCACRREWTCHKCEAVEAWRSVREQ